MLPLYIFCACLGIPLLALFAFGGSDGDAELGDAGFDVDADISVGADVDAGGDFELDSGLGGADGGVGDITAALRRIPVSSYAFFLSFFGGGGIVGNLLDMGFVLTLILAVSLGLIASFTNTAVFSYLRNTDTTSQLTDRQIEGRVATVSIPIDAGKRGRVVFDTGDERIQLTAGSVDSELDKVFDRGEKVVIVEMSNGVAKVMAVDPDLQD